MEEAELATVRGSVRFAELATRTRTGVTLPCRYERRTPDVLLNQLLLAGLRLARGVVANGALVREIARLQMHMEEYVQPIPLTEDAFRSAGRGITCLNAHYRPALDLCYLLFRHATHDGANGAVRHFPGFLLDMNQLFERFVGRLLDEIVPEPYQVQQQSRLSFYTAPPGQPAPHLRPDFRIVDAGGRVHTIVDAKYKLLDVRRIDMSDLYQLTIYAMADEPTQGRVIALYPGSPSHEVSRGVRDRVYKFEGPNHRPMNVTFRRLELSGVWGALRSPEGKAGLYRELLVI